MSIDIDAIEARVNAATPGPWYSDDSDNMDDAGNHYSVMYGDGWYLARIWNDLKQSNYVADAAFIAAARQDVPALCAEARELRAALAMYSKLDGDDGLASSNRLLAACERGDGIDQHAAPDIMAARAEIVAQRAALERARALVAKWEAEAEQTGSWERLDTLSDCTDELAAALASGGAA